MNSSEANIGARRSPARILVPALLLALGAALVAVAALWPKPDVHSDTPVVPPANVVVQTIAPVPELPDTLELTAVIEPNRVVDVAAEVAGRVERIAERSQDVAWMAGTIPRGTPLDEGQPVRAGDSLLYLNRDLLAARHDRALAQFEYDEREYTRIEALFKAESTSKTELDDARTKREISRALLDEATRELERTTITAPISGVLNRLPMELGEFASPGDPVAQIVELDPVKVIVDVPERDIGRLQVGHTAEVVPRAGPALAGTISYISSLADEGTRTTRVELTIPNPEYTLRSGQIVRARLTRRVVRDAIMIPLASVIPLEHGREVYVVEDGQAQPRTVELGMLRGRSVEVLRGLEAGDRLIVVGQRLVGPGQRVNIVGEQPGGGSAPELNGSGSQAALGRGRP